MNSNDNYYIGAVLRAITDVLNDNDTVINPQIKTTLESTMNDYETYSTIKIYKSQERLLYQDKKFDLYNQLKAKREELEQQLNNQP